MRCDPPSRGGNRAREAWNLRRPTLHPRLSDCSNHLARTFHTAHTAPSGWGICSFGTPLEHTTSWQPHLFSTMIDGQDCAGVRPSSCSVSCFHMEFHDIVGQASLSHGKRTCAISLCTSVKSATRVASAPLPFLVLTHLRSKRFFLGPSNFRFLLRLSDFLELI